MKVAIAAVLTVTLLLGVTVLLSMIYDSGVELPILGVFAVLKEMIFVTLGGIVTAAAGLFVAYKIFTKQRSADAAAVASLVVAVVEQTQVTLESLDRGWSDDQTVENFRLLTDQIPIFESLIPQLGILGPERASYICSHLGNLKYLLRQTEQIEAIERKWGKPSPAHQKAVNRCLKSAHKLRDMGKLVIKGLCRKYSLSFTQEEIE